MSNVVESPEASDGRRVALPIAPETRASGGAAGAPRRMRAAAAVIAGRASGALARRLRLGGGTSLPGLVANRIDPDLTAFLGAQLRYGSVVVTGTNGKTTTSGLVAYTLRDAGLRVWRNREGSNLARGVTTALLIRAQPSGKLQREGDAVSVFEVDEAAFPQVLAELQPRAVVVTNLFRDQLDRYGEVDTVAERWRGALAALPAGTTLALNADDPAVAALADAAPRLTTLFYGVENVIAPRGEDEVAPRDVLDTRSCPRCHTPLDFSRRFYSHVGHWVCPNCGNARPLPQVFARDVRLGGFAESAFTLVTPAGAQEVRLALPGLYNVYNGLSAATIGAALGVAPATIATALGRFTPAFGRAERIAVEGRELRLLLAKNPTGLNEALRAVASDGRRHHFLLLLNDRAADGEDVSWIWDADFEQLAGRVASVTVSGTRAYDLALRLKYAGAHGEGETATEPDPGHALDVALPQVPVGEALYVVPTYTAMLAIRGELERRGYAPHYWEQRDV